PRDKISHPLTFLFLFFFFKDPPTPEIYTLSLHDALPISPMANAPEGSAARLRDRRRGARRNLRSGTSRDLCPLSPRYHRLRRSRSEEHTSELQSRGHLVCRLLLEKKKTSMNSSRSRAEAV